MEPGTPGVTAFSFYKLAEVFVQSISYLLQDGRKVLLLFDGYRSHMHLNVLEYLDKNGVVVYALPAHTSGKTQPCDTGVFRGLKREVSKAASEVGRIPAASPMNVYDFCSLLNYAYSRSLIAPKFMFAFAASGVWPLNRQKLLGVAPPRSGADLRTIIGVDELEKMYLEKCKVARKRILGEEVFEVRKCFVATMKG